MARWIERLYRQSKLRNRGTIVKEMESKIAFVFPGVGSQHTGMVKSFYENSAIARETFENASDILGLDFKKICFQKEYAETLNEINVSQLSLVTASIAIYRVFEKEIGISPNYCLGHSLGEYSALCAGGILDFSEMLQIVRERGRIIKEITLTSDGTMIWAINIDHKTLSKLCDEVSEDGNEVYISAYDCPTQCSVSGKNDAILKLTKKLEAAGAIVYPLQMAGPYHTPLMMRASDEMRAYLQQFHFHKPKCDIISNYNTLPYPTEKDKIIENLALQLISPIRWQESILGLVDHQVKYVMEIGPKDVLKFLTKKITPELEPFSFNNFSLCSKVKNLLLIQENDYQKVIEQCLKVATSTRNRNTNEQEYYEKVVLPYRRIEEVYYDNLKQQKTPSAVEVRNAINMAETVMKNKKVSQDMLQKRMNEILQGRFLRNM